MKQPTRSRLTFSNIAHNEPAVPSFGHGLRVQEVMEVIARSAREERWAKLIEISGGIAFLVALMAIAWIQEIRPGVQ